MASFRQPSPSTPGASASSVTDKSFTIFRRLPKELRAGIWRFAALHEPRIIELDCRTTQLPPPSSTSTHFASTQTQPLLLTVSEEARAEALKCYIRLSSTNKDHAILINPTIDTVYFHGWSWMTALFDGFPSLPRPINNATMAWNTIQHAALDVRGDSREAAPWETTRDEAVAMAAHILTSFPDLKSLTFVLHDTACKWYSIDSDNQNVSTFGQSVISFSAIPPSSGANGSMRYVQYFLDAALESLQETDEYAEAAERWEEVDVSVKCMKRDGNRCCTHDHLPQTTTGK